MRRENSLFLFSVSIYRREPIRFSAGGNEALYKEEIAKGEIFIEEKFCRGCGYCAHFCSRGCIEISRDRITSEGYLLPLFINPDRCTACGVCAWMCPTFAIEVYKYVEE